MALSDFHRKVLAEYDRLTAWWWDLTTAQKDHALYPNPSQIALRLLLTEHEAQVGE